MFRGPVEELEGRLREANHALEELYVVQRDNVASRARLEAAMRSERDPARRNAIARQFYETEQRRQETEHRILYLRGRRDQIERDVVLGRIRAKNEGEYARRIHERLRELDRQSRSLGARARKARDRAARIAHDFRIVPGAARGEFGPFVLAPHEFSIADPKARQQYDFLTAEFRAWNDRRAQVDRERVHLEQRLRELRAQARGRTL
ncbi:MAG TPA: hypothetical protein VMG99_08985 [Thermoplasmata archaeon]|nr:hypothetical protein [Thermoplasmata archaeon]